MPRRSRSNQLLRGAINTDGVAVTLDVEVCSATAVAVAVCMFRGSGECRIRVDRKFEAPLRSTHFGRDSRNVFFSASNDLRFIEGIVLTVARSCSASGSLDQSTYQHTDTPGCPRRRA